MKFTEEKLSVDLKSGVTSRLYYFYGEELFLTETYVGRVLDKVIGKNHDDINVIKLGGTFSVDTLYDSVESLPMFSDTKAVVINDLDLDKYSDEDSDRIIEILQNIPEECTVIVYLTGITPSGGRKNKNKNFIATLAKQENCVLCEFTQLDANNIAELVIKKAAKNGCVISRANALYLVNCTLCNLTLCSIETEKLCCYRQSGEITKEDIDALTVKQLDTSIYALSTAITRGNKKEALMILDDLFAQRIEPIVILAALSSNYIDFYRAAVARDNSVTPEKCAEDFSYAKNRSFVVSKAFNTVSKLSPEYVRKCLKILFDADIKLKTTSVNGRTVLEQT
ncbi:MAG: DNA polymerase III subunit delta, partial [Ruminiclostridium sp.]|nr:DNA polymerase III subunit delta [Ruminiclostridium sp.]